MKFNRHPLIQTPGSVHSHKMSWSSCPSGTCPTVQRDKSGSDRWKYTYQNTSENEILRIIRPKADL